MPTIIYPRALPWNWMVQRPQQLMKELATLGYTVFYEEPGSFSRSQVQKVADSLYLCRGISPLSLEHSRPRILWLNFPQHYSFVEDYRPDLVVYDCADEAKEEFSSWGPYIKPLLAKSHLVFASAQSLYEQLAKEHPQVTLLPNGVDFFHFAHPRKPPLDLPEGKILVGYSGAIAPWLDWELLEKVIAQHPQVHFIFIGALVMLKNFPLQGPNVTYLGHKPYEVLPSYIQQFSVGLIPFKLTSMTQGCNPIKLYEYAAAGVPILGTNLPELEKVQNSLKEKENPPFPIENALSLANGPKEFSTQLRELLKQARAKEKDLEEKNLEEDQQNENNCLDPVKDLLQDFAFNNTWQKRTLVIHSILSNYQLSRSTSVTLRRNFE
ncbi:MAG: glycosyltransferase family 1 protein [Desulfitobacterium sp.]|nr:glycosyltransferase family 1 protein [Desulfitobacterium sp.]